MAETERTLTRRRKRKRKGGLEGGGAHLS